MGDPSDGCQNGISKWGNRRGGIHWTTRGLWNSCEEISCMQIEESLVWVETSTKSMVCLNRWLLVEEEVCQEWCGSGTPLSSCRERVTNLSIVCGWSLFDRIIQTHWGLQEASSHRIRYEGFGTNALLPRVGSLAVEGRNLPWAREVCYKNPEKIQDGAL